EDLKKSKHFYRTCKRILSDFNSKSKRQKFYEETSLSFVSNAFMALCCAGTLLLTFLIAANYQPYLMFEYVPIVVFASIYAYLCISKGQYFQAVIMIFFFAGAGVNIFVIDGFVKLFKNSPELLWQLAGGIICTVITATCFVQMAKPNHKGRWYKAQLLGLKKFIEVAEKPRLEKMVEKNPEYFYKVLPYAYILGVSDKWIKKLEDVLPAEATQNYQYNNFNSFARGFSSAAAPSVENGGIKRRSSSGGGGFSGGGFGGGGGGSW
ncbi:MAG: DUF2207 domain-containing protein, partial [Alphaproteobacteria bacterium]|nr:DUF2207 domain-containing protein [Alphaproteobacteria bacterium]